MRAGWSGHVRTASVTLTPMTWSIGAAISRSWLQAMCTPMRYTAAMGVAMFNPARYDYANELARKVAPEVWKGLSGNGSLRINIDTDVDCYGDWEPHGHAPYDSPEGRVQDAQHWVEYFVFNTINRLINRDLLNVPEDQ